MTSTEVTLSHHDNQKMKIKKKQRNTQAYREEVRVKAPLVSGGKRGLSPLTSLARDLIKILELVSPYM